MSRDPFFDAIRDQLLPDATDTEIESLFGQYLGAQPEPVFIAHIAGDPKPQGSKRYVGGGRVIEDNPGTRVWRQSAQLQLATYRSRQLKDPIDEAVLVQAVFCLPRRPRQTMQGARGRPRRGRCAQKRLPNHHMARP